ncbi:MAG: sulfotransferase family protein [Phycisphaerales bacterium JB037]
MTAHANPTSCYNAPNPADVHPAPDHSCLPPDTPSPNPPPPGSRGNNLRLPTPERLATATARALPDFIILGAMKAGTTALFRMLRTHPRFAPPIQKELHFFDLPNRYAQGLDWYRAFFPLRDRLERRPASPRGVTGESSPYYLYHPHAAARIARDLPHTRFVVLLRDPAARAISHYFHAQRKGWENRPIEQAFDEELADPAALHRPVANNPNLLFPRHQIRSYVHRGQYADQLETWLGVIPRDRFLILQAESFFADPVAICRRVQSFLWLNPISLAPPRKVNKGRYDRSSIAPVERRLRDYYAPHNERLFDLLNTRYPWPE